ncbi:uncharacterized protein LOC111048962 [Nilaparvata lugens]|uniref:uncharacterized protein LOC111048962 n=1 Tax=Nilaparvata lugens TaxID=108931 RepID=UPI00193D7F87|nr:uncharacterized protein LOC111048962 [Nilaparvata lugens]
MMFSAYFKSAFLLTVFVSLGEGFFLYGKKSSAPRESSPPQWQQQYSLRGDNNGLGWPVHMSFSPHNGQMSPFAFDAVAANPTAVTVALPVAVPIQAAHMTKMSSPAQMSPHAQTPQLHNVQLVPCLCPVSKDFDPLPQAPTPSAASPSTASFVAAVANPDNQQ